MRARGGGAEVGRDSSRGVKKSKARSWNPWVKLLLALAVGQVVFISFFWSSVGFGGDPELRSLELPNLTAFADPDSKHSGLKVRPNDIALLLMASGKRADLLRICLQSLYKMEGFDPTTVLVAQAAPDGESEQLVRDAYSLAWLGPGGADAGSSSHRAELEDDSRWPGTAHYRQALGYAAKKHFVESRYKAIFIFTEDLILSSDVLWYLAQLVPVLNADPTLACISAFNDIGLAPYVADITTIMRTDWFSGVAWMVTMDALTGDLLPHWPHNGDWRAWLRSRTAKGHQQCVFPEVSRVAFSSTSCATMQVQGSGKVRAPDQFCDDEVAAAQSVSSRSLATSALGINLGDVQRVTSERYLDLFMNSWPAGQGLMHATPVQSLSELEVSLDVRPHRAIEHHKISPHRPLRLTFARAEVEEETGRAWDSWEHIAAYFGFPPGGPRAMYNGVARIWWRDCVLYLASLNSPLLASLGDDVGAVLHGAAFAKQRQLPAPMPVPPHSFLGAATVGTSCERYCETRGQTCLDADLGAISRCAPPLTALFECRHCLTNAGSDAYPGFNRQTDQCGGGSPQALLNGVSAGDCAADGGSIRRACVCREQTKKKPLHLLSAGSQLIHAIHAGPGAGAIHIAEEKAAVPASTSFVNEKVLDRAALHRFSASSGRGGRQREPAPGLELAPSDIPVLVIAASVKREVRRDLTKLRATLTSLLSARRIRNDQVLVAHDEALNLATAHMIEHEFSLKRIMVDASAGADGSSSDTGSIVAEVYRKALGAALDGPFAAHRSMVVLEEGLEVAPDFLWYFAQLQTLLDRDATLWCISAWNENGLAPFAADPTAVMRTDVFPGLAWLMLTEALAHLLGLWPERDWERWMQTTARHGKQCLIPEVSRVVYSSATPPPEPGKKRKHTSSAIQGHSPDGNARRLGVLLCDRDWVHLGNVERLHDMNYRQLIYEAWPGEGLVNSKLVTSVRDLVRELERGDGTPLRVVFQNSDAEVDESWRSVAQFFGLRRSVPMPGSYHGVVRLRWHLSTLYLVSSSSPFVHSSFGVEAPQDMQNSAKAFLAGIGPAQGSDALLPTAFATVTAPVLKGPDVVVLVAPEEGASCEVTCAAEAKVCRPADLFFLNACGALTRAVACGKCKAGEGDDLPSMSGFVEDESDGGRSAELCHFNTNWATFAPSCSASHKDSRRLCSCRPGVDVAPGYNRRDNQPSSGESQTAAPGRAGRLRGGARGDAAQQAKPQQSGFERNRAQAAAAGEEAFSDVAVLEDLRSVQPPEFASSLDIQPKELAVVILTTGSKSSANSLRQTLRSLARLPGFNAFRVLVSQDGLGDAVKRVASSEFKVSWVQHKDTGTEDFKERVALHYYSAISHALQEHFKGVRSLIVMEGDVLVSADFFWYFAQLESTMLKDTSIWCVSAWSDNALSPYVWDPAALGRSDVFSGVAWMLPADRWREELLWTEPTTVWEAYVQAGMRKAGGQCIVPEVPRVAHVGVAAESGNQDSKSPERLMRDAGMFSAQPGSTSEVLAVDLHDSIRRIEKKDVYRKAFTDGLRNAEVLEGFEELPPPLSEDGQAATGSWRLQCSTEEQWPAVARFFYLSAVTPPRGSLEGVVRLRWGSGWLFLATASSPLPSELGLQTATSPLQSPSAMQRPVIVAGGATVIAASELQTGKSCSALCASREQQCVASDLVFVNTCDALRKFHFCERCAASTGSDQPAVQAVGHGRHGACFYNSDYSAFPPSCDATNPDMRRLCVCRPLLAEGAVQTLGAVKAAKAAQLSSAGRAAPPTKPKQGVGGSKSRAGARSGKSGAAAAAATSAEAAPAKAGANTAWQPGTLAKPYSTDVAAFADPTAPIGLLETKPQDLAVLVVVLDSRREVLEACIDALISATKFSPSQVLVSFSDAFPIPELQRWLSSELRLGTVLHEVLAKVASNLPAELESMHYHMALQHAFTGPFQRSRSLVVLDSLSIVSPDILWYFAQLEPLLHADDSLWCVTAWNDNGLAPYVSDPTALMRSDSHPALTFMLRAETFWKDLHPSWPTNRLEDFLQDRSVRQERQCVFPEVARMRRQRPASGSRADFARYEEHVAPVMWNEYRERIHLGDVHRMAQEAYEKLLFKTWPANQSLTQAEEVAKAGDLQKIEVGTHRLVLDGTAGVWSAASNYLRLPAPRADVLPGSYHGLLRLRWKGAVLYVVLRNSPLLPLADVEVKHTIQGKGLPVRPPILRAPDVTVVLSAQGESCEVSCSHAGQFCITADLLFLNACGVMKQFLPDGGCGDCGMGSGPEPPAVLLGSSISSEMGPGTCLWNPNLAAPPSCTAAHPSLARVCACRPVLMEFGMSAATLAPEVVKRRKREGKDRDKGFASEEAVRPLARLAPWTQLDPALTDYKCGASYGNHMSPTCEKEEMWCCSAEGVCGDTAAFCNGPGGRQECTAKPSSQEFCGAGWSLRLPHFHLKPPAER